MTPAVPPFKTLRLFPRPAIVAIFLMAGLFARGGAAPYGVEQRSPSGKRFQQLQVAASAMPALLSQTGIFKDLKGLQPDDALVPYDLIVPFWSDGASKERWILLPNDGKIRFSTNGEWSFPAGTVFVKTFELATNETQSATLRRLETRLLVLDPQGGVFGVTYKWRPDNSDADLLKTNLTEEFKIQTANGQRIQNWYYPSQADCLTCHNTNAGLVLGVKTRQVNRNFAYPGGVSDNELRTWSHLGFFENPPQDSTLSQLPALARSDDASKSIEDRARSYLDANCANCHRPRGTVASFDTRYDTPLQQQNIVGAHVLIDQRIDNARVVAPNDIWRSLLYARANTTEPMKMPPLARNEIDTNGMRLLRDWIESLPGPPVLPPPAVSPPGGSFNSRQLVTLKSDPGASIRYTLDGTIPTTNDLLYEKPVELNSATILRARAFKPGYKQSISIQQTFLFGN